MRTADDCVGSAPIAQYWDGLWGNGGNRARTYRCRICLGVAFGAATIVGCGSAKPAATPTAVLRGIPVSAFTCPPHPVSPAASPAPIAMPETLLLCPLNVPGIRSRSVTLVWGQPLFPVLLAALSAPNITPTSGVCAAYADVPQVVLAPVGNKVYQVSIPTDACGHYQRGALDALDRARAG